LTADLSSVASGTVLAVNAQIGQHVSRGELLVQIDDGPLQAQLAAGSKSRLGTGLTAPPARIPASG